MNYPAFQCRLLCQGTRQQHMIGTGIYDGDLLTIDRPVS